jgi:hypothetical protein
MILKQVQDMVGMTGEAGERVGNEQSHEKRVRLHNEQLQEDDVLHRCHQQSITEGARAQAELDSRLHSALQTEVSCVLRSRCLHVGSHCTGETAQELAQGLEDQPHQVNEPRDERLVRGVVRARACGCRNRVGMTGKAGVPYLPPQERRNEASPLFL